MNVNNDCAAPRFARDRPTNTNHLPAALAELEILTQEIDHENAG